jgi:hypothetical protein
VGEPGHLLDRRVADRVPDTPANRQAFGSAGTTDDSSPYPQQRDLWLSHAFTRATLAVTSGRRERPFHAMM